MVTLDEAFEDWLDEMMTGNQTRREFAKDKDIKLFDLEWAFMTGWIRGQRQLKEEFKK